MNKRLCASVLAVAAVTAVFPMETRAEANIDLRKKVVGMAGIMSVFNTQSTVTRGEFAKMIVKASSYGNGVGQNGATSVFADVPRSHEDAAYIRVAVENGWMRGYLGGVFRPEQPVTLRDAASAVLGLLGYTDKDFTGDVIGGKLAKYHFLKLDENIDREPDEVLNRTDCIHLFYNLLKTTPKDGGGIYGKLFQCELTSDGEINPLNMADNELKGPKLIRKKKNLSAYIPFKLEQANVFLNGEGSSVLALNAAIESNDFVLVYFHPGTKTIWAYTEDGGETGRGVIRGKVTNIYYSSANVMTPSAVTLDGQGEQYQLKSSQMQFAFSMYGDVRVGDQVALIYEKTTQSDGTETYTVIDYLED